MLPAEPTRAIEPAFDRLMLEFDEPALKSLLVGIDETAQATGQPAADPDVLLNGLVKTYQRKEIEKRRPAADRDAREGGLDEPRRRHCWTTSCGRSEISQERLIRQGISKPTDG